MTNIPLVSVCVTTFNHENYIEKCLEGILLQKTSFSFEIILGEDDSKDRTREICKNYAKKYPKIIRLFLRSEKDKIYIHGSPTGRYNYIQNLKSARGKYIALCDGDDYWTDMNKLQKQVDFLEDNSEFSMIGHNAWIINENSETNELARPLNSKKVDFQTKDLILHNPFVSSMTLFRNKNIFGVINRIKNKPVVADWNIFTHLSHFGKCRFIDEPVGYYRVHEKSITYNDRRVYKKFREDLIKRINHAKYWNFINHNKYEKEEAQVLARRSRALSSEALRNFDLKTAIKYSKFILYKDLNNLSSKIVVFVLKMLNNLLFE